MIKRSDESKQRAQQVFSSNIDAPEVDTYNVTLPKQLH